MIVHGDLVLLLVMMAKIIYGLGPKLQKFGLRPDQRVAFDVDFDMKGDKAINVRPA